MESFTEIKLAMFSEQIDEAHKTREPGACIMLIDDDLDISEALISLLQSHYRLISCRSFEEAKKQLTPDIKLVLLDIKMASKDGIEAFKLLRDEHADLAIVFHSAYPGSGEKAGALERLSHNGYLTKGEYDLSELLTTIERAMNSREPAPAVTDEMSKTKVGEK